MKIIVNLTLEYIPRKPSRLDAIYYDIAQFVTKLWI